MNVEGEDCNQVDSVERILEEATPVGARPQTYHVLQGEPCNTDELDDFQVGVFTDRIGYRIPTVIPRHVMTPGEEGFRLEETVCCVSYLGYVWLELWKRAYGQAEGRYYYEENGDDCEDLKSQNYLY